MTFSKKSRLIISFCSFLFAAAFFHHGLAQEEPKGTMPVEIALSIRGTYVPFQSVLSIYNDGRVTYIEENGLGPDKEVINKSGKISGGEFKNLAAAISSNNFLKLKKHYDDPKILDANYTTITVKFGHQTYSVEDYGGAAPDAFHNIAGKLSEIKGRTIFAE